MKTLIAATVIASLACIHHSYARIIDVADHGIQPGKDNTFALNRLIESVAKESGVTLSFPKGRYDFHPENAIETYRAVSNHDNGLKRMAFPFFGHRDLTVDGNGSEFIFHGHMVPFTSENTKNLTLKNFSIDWIRPFHAELETITSDSKTNTATFRLDPDIHPHFIEGGQLFLNRFHRVDPIGSNIVYDPQTRSPIYKTTDYSLNWKRTTASKTAPNLVTLSGGFKKSPPPVGSILVVYGVHPTSRLAPAIHVTNSESLTIENVTAYNAGGMALIVERTENVTLKRMTVTSNEKLYAATRADATHFIGCKGTIKIEECLFENMLDDATNIHGAYVPIEEQIGKNQLIFAISHFQQMDLIFAEPGDRVALLSRETILPFFETTITDIEKLNEKRFVVTLANLPDELPDVPLSLENLTWYPDVIMRGNTIRENRARSALISTKGKVLIEGNYFSSQMHGILIEGDNNKWYESGAVQDVTINNNTFENIGFSGQRHYPLYVSPLLNDSQRMGEGHYHSGIKFTNNTVKGFNSHMVFARSVKDLEITGNTIQLIEGYPRRLEEPAITLDYAKNVLIENNKAIGFSSPLKISGIKETSGITLHQNEGFETE